MGLLDEIAADQGMGGLLATLRAQGASDEGIGGIFAQLAPTPAQPRDIPVRGAATTSTGGAEPAIATPLAQAVGTMPSVVQARKLFSSPQRVYSGELPMVDLETGRTSDAAVEAGLELAGAAMTGGVAGAAARGADNSLGMFGGRLAKTADRAALAKAEEMSAKGASRDAIWQETGWFQGQDGKWRFEIDDSKADLSARSKYQLNNSTAGITMDLNRAQLAFHHPELFKAYKETAPFDGKVEAMRDPRAVGGSYTPEGDEIFMQGPDAASLRSTGLHELQHAVQGREGFARGGSPRNYTQQKEATLARDALAFRREMDQFPKEMDDIAKANAVVQSYKEQGIRDWLPSAEAREVALNKLDNPDTELERVVKVYGLDQRSSPYSSLDIYKRLAGEVEARNVQARRDMTPEERRARPPWETQDVPDNQVILGSGATDRKGAAATGGLFTGSGDGAKGDNFLASRSARLYDPPVKSARPFEADYPAGASPDATGRLTHDIEGRPLAAKHVVGRNVVGGSDQAFPAEELNALATAATGRLPENVPSRAIGGDAGRLVLDRRSGRPTGTAIDQGLKPEQGARVLAHELGHAVDILAGSVPSKGLTDELKVIYNDLNNPSRGGGKPTTPSAHGYKGANVNQEMMAEAVRAYMADPNYIKTVAPKTAAAIRAAVNANPDLMQTIQFNSNGAPGGLLGLLVAEDDERRRASAERAR